MEKQEKILFIGGSRDGEVYAFPRLQSSMELLVSPQPTKVESIEKLPAKPATFQKETYHLEKLKAENDYFIYRHESLGIDDVFEKLLSGYKPNDK